MREHSSYGLSCTKYVASDRYSLRNKTTDLLPNPWIIRLVLCAKYGLDRRDLVLFRDHCLFEFMQS